MSWSSSALATLLLAGCPFLTRDDFLERLDPDGDGVLFPDDCDDSNPSVGEGTEWFRDADGDGQGAGEPKVRCVAPTGWVASDEDCDDTDPLVGKGMTEVCDFKDNDCDGKIDEGIDHDRLYPDADGDWFGTDSGPIEACAWEEGYAYRGGDCDDANPAINPGVAEVCDNVDNDCDGYVDEGLATWAWYPDKDGDGYGAITAAVYSCEVLVGFSLLTGDCDDDNPAVNPHEAEDCDDGVDTNCDGVYELTTAYLDGDGDGYGDPSTAWTECPFPANATLLGGDCDDTDARVFPGATEDCTDGIDNDCDGWVDPPQWYVDADGDGYGDPHMALAHCPGLAGEVANPFDCEDSDPDLPVRVDASAGSVSGDGTAANPFLTVSDALASGASCVAVGPGTYAESVRIPDTDFILFGAEGSGSTVIDGGGGPCVPATGAGCSSTVAVESSADAFVVLSGLTIRGGGGTVRWTTSSFSCTAGTCTATDGLTVGGGLYASGSRLMLRDLVVEGSSLPADATSTDAGGDTTSTSSAGGGVALFDSSVTGTMIQILGGSAHWGGGLYVDGAIAMLSQVLVEGGTATAGGALAVVDADLTLASSRVLRGQATRGGGAYIGEDALLLAAQVEFTENEAENGGAILVHDGTLSATQLRSWCNQATGEGGSIAIADGEGTVDLTWSDFYGDDALTRGGIIWAGAGSILQLRNFVSESDSARASFDGDGSGRIRNAVVMNQGVDVFGGDLSAGDGVIEAGGQFTGVNCDGDPDNDDFALVAGAAAEDASDPADGNDGDGTPYDAGSNGGSGGAW